MRKLAFVYALAAGIAVAGQAVAQAPTAPGSAGGAGASATACPKVAAEDEISGSGSDIHNHKVFACNGVRVGTAASSSKNADGIVLNILPDANFLNGVSTFQISAKGATTNGNGDIVLGMTDRGLREYLSAH